MAVTTRPGKREVGFMDSGWFKQAGTDGSGPPASAGPYIGSSDLSGVVG
jgi:hypothetical protein